MPKPSLAEDRDAVEQALGRSLIAAGKLDERSLERARRVGSGNRQGLARVLPKLGLVSERDLAEALARQAGVPLVSERNFPALPLLQDRVSIRFLKESRVLPLAETAETLVLAMADPFDRFAIDAMRLAAGKAIESQVAVQAELEAAIDRLYAEGDAAAQVADDGDADDSVEYDIEQLQDMASEAPVIRLVNRLIEQAVEAGASDIHLEPRDAGLRVRVSVDGALRDIDSPPDRYRAAFISRIKILARLNIAQRQMPQDGRIKMVVRGIPVDLRVATLPTVHGESVVLRILDRDAVALDFGTLGIGGRDLDDWLGVLERPHGLVLVTGPTGSGKTTTLYTSLLRLSTPDKKIITVEDPVEYQLPDIVQSEVKPQIGLTFAQLLRALLRNAPDIMLVGEIRDPETAKTAIEFALTGHLVLSTVHTNSAAASVPRLLDMGVEEYLLASTLNGVAGQRLVRTLCTKCREPYAASPEMILRLGLRRYSEAPEMLLYRARGCAACGGSGYLGRTSIIETLTVKEPIRRLILDRADAGALQAAAVADGMRTLHDNGMEKAVAGLTSIEEVLQATRDA
ncbi:MAG: Flp pilus assembly complex ATPase component TadA [Inquilinus sp.]|nr:Flp pilus assembly complex ATPase component TadA [Inquilinus sp.]